MEASHTAVEQSFETDTIRPSDNTHVKWRRVVSGDAFRIEHSTNPLSIASHECMAECYLWAEMLCS